MSRKQRELDMLSSFNEITGAPMDSCRFFLESSNWNLELALSRFYNPDEHEQSDFSRQDIEGAWNQNVDLDQTGQSVGGGGGSGTGGVSEEAIEELEDDMDIEETWGPKVGASKLNLNDHQNVGEDTGTSGTNAESDDKRKKGDKKPVASPATTTNPKSSSRIGSMSTLRAHESSSEEEEGQVYYAGGSEHSGQQVVGPSRGSHDIISEIFHSLKDEGRVEAITSRPSAPQSFSGQGYRLGQSSNDTPSLTSMGSSDASRRDSKPSVVLRFWQNGFSINDGPLRSYDDPKERMFLAGISKGNVPSELYCQADKGGAVHLTLQDRRHENYVAPANKPVPFTGRGHVLGRTETVKPYLSSVQPEQSSPKEDKEAPNPKKGVTEKTLLNVNPKEAVTTVQVRLPDGERLQIKLNQTHTVADLRMAVVEMRPELCNQLFTLVALYPRRELSDDNFTLIQADLLNSSILLRL